MSDGIIEYFYSAHSAFAYIGSARLSELAAKAGRRLVHRVIHLSPVIEAVGGKSFHERTAQHTDYFFGREIERWADFRKVPIVDFRPTYHDADMTMASTMIIAAQDMQLDADQLAHAILQAHWRDDADISVPEKLMELARQVGIDAERLTTEAAIAGRFENLQRQH